MPVSEDDAREALDRMRRAHERGAGCRLTARMIAGLSITRIGELWHDDKEPRDKRKRK